MDTALDGITRSAPFFGPIIVVLVGAIVWLAHELRATMQARVLDAQETTKVLVAVNTSTTTVLNGVTTGVTALGGKITEIDHDVAELRDAMPRRPSR